MCFSFSPFPSIYLDLTKLTELRHVGLDINLVEHLERGIVDTKLNPYSFK